jgi:hypothetical protein
MPMYVAPAHFIAGWLMSSNLGFPFDPIAQIGGLWLIYVFAPFSFIYFLSSRKKQNSSEQPLQQQPATPAPQSTNTELDTEFYEQALAELDSDDRDTGIWAKAYAEADNEESSRRLYVKLRAKSLKQNWQGAEQQSEELDELRKAKIEEAGRRLNAEIIKAENESNWLSGYVVIGYGLSALFVIAGLIESPAIIFIALPFAYFGYSKRRELMRKKQEIKAAKSVLTAHGV